MAWVGKYNTPKSQTIFKSPPVSHQFLGVNFIVKKSLKKIVLFVVLLKKFYIFVVNN